jgi:prepilin-type N-terminal cleavage/methylation domain-containing protein
MKHNHCSPALAKGFTLVEVLVALGIFSVVIVSALQLQQNSSNVSRVIINTASLQEEVRNVAALINDEVQRAVYVFPPCGVYKTDGSVAPILNTCSTSVNPAWYDTSGQKVSVVFSRFTLAASGNTTKRPDTGSRIWTPGVNAAPILAMIVAPRRPGTGTCMSANAAEQARSCYQFVAYYPIKRSDVTRASGSTSSEQLDVDPGNQNQWVLMEFRRNISVVMSGRTQALGGLSVTTPDIHWTEVGCDSSGYSCTTLGAAPRFDPEVFLQRTNRSLPALRPSTGDPVEIGSFVVRMFDVVQNVTGTGGSIVLVGVRPWNGTTSGFQISYPTGAVDARGVTEVRIRLQGELIRGANTYRFPSQGPIEVYASPRNLATIN